MPDGAPRRPVDAGFDDHRHWPGQESLLNQGLERICGADAAKIGLDARRGRQADERGRFT